MEKVTSRWCWSTQVVWDDGGCPHCHVLTVPRLVAKMLWEKKPLLGPGVDLQNSGHVLIKHFCGLNSSLFKKSDVRVNALSKKGEVLLGEVFLSPCCYAKVSVGFI